MVDCDSGHVRHLFVVPQHRRRTAQTVAHVQNRSLCRLRFSKAYELIPNPSGSGRDAPLNANPREARIQQVRIAHTSTRASGSRAANLFPARAPSFLRFGAAPRIRQQQYRANAHVSPGPLLRRVSARRCQSVYDCRPCQRSSPFNETFSTTRRSKRIRENPHEVVSISVSAIGIASGFSVSPGAKTYSPIAPPDDP